MADGVGLNVRSRDRDKHGEEYSTDTVSAEISMFAADGTLTQCKTPHILHTGRLF